MMRCIRKIKSLWPPRGIRRRLCAHEKPNHTHTRYSRPVRPQIYMVSRSTSIECANRSSDFVCVCRPLNRLNCMQIIAFMHTLTAAMLRSSSQSFVAFIGGHREYPIITQVNLNRNDNSMGITDLSNTDFSFCIVVR